MLFQSLFAASLVVAASAAPVRREVPQEHSHEKFLTAVRAAIALGPNPLNIGDPVFGLLGNAAAAGGLGNFKDGADCLQTATADLAFTNAKAAKSVDGMVAALQFRAIERNSAGVGKLSVICTAYKPVNPEIAALTQHQDPASTGAAATNKAIVLELAKQIKAVGGDPQLALETGTFKPGDVNDNTFKGNTCDDANDKEGCIFTQNLLVEDATPAEIDAAVGGAAAAPAATTTAAAEVAASTTAPEATAAPAATSAAAADDTCPVLEPVTVTVQPAAATATAAAATDCAPAATVTVTVTAGAAAATDVAAAPAAATTSAAAAAPAATGAAAASTDANLVPIVSTSTAKFGTCTNAGVTRAGGLNGRKATEVTFIPSNLSDFNHGEALNPQIIYTFICDTFVNKCGGTNDDVSKCKAFAATITTRDAAAANTWNTGIEQFAF